MRHKRDQEDDHAEKYDRRTGRSPRLLSRKLSEAKQSGDYRGRYDRFINAVLSSAETSVVWGLTVERTGVVIARHSLFVFAAAVV